ncbi:MAG: DUF3795 domain-containing protein [Promethearchaeota archaeon]
MTREFPLKKYATIACCGLDCGLCPSYYTKGPSRCPGCCGPNFIEKHPSCSIITCCVKKNDFETCAECNQFPCSKIDKWDKFDSFISHKVSLSNLNTIKQKGIEPFLDQQKRRIELLKTMLKEFNEGRSKSFYCIASALLPIKRLETALEESNEIIKKEGVDVNDLKNKSKILKDKIRLIASKENMDLKLRKK